MFQLEMVSLEDLVSPTHQYRKFRETWKWEEVHLHLESIKSPTCNGYSVTRLFSCLLLQFMEDLSDRELERYLQENTASKWFCDFTLTEKTPDYTVFTKFRSRVGTKKLSELFGILKAQLHKRGLMNEAFSVVDATHLIAKASLWEERDKVISKKLHPLNNTTLPKVSHDKQARIVCKGKGKFWYGYKESVCIDVESGMINKIAVTPANVPDAHAFRHVAPVSGEVYADKGYCGNKAKQITEKKGCVLRAIKKNNMKAKNKREDRKISTKRRPYERVFAHMQKRVRYVGVAKNQFTSFMRAICFNMKRVVVLQDSYANMRK